MSFDKVKNISKKIEAINQYYLKENKFIWQFIYVLFLIPFLVIAILIHELKLNFFLEYSLCIILAIFTFSLINLALVKIKNYTENKASTFSIKQNIKLWIAVGLLTICLFAVFIFNNFIFNVISIPIFLTVLIIVAFLILSFSFVDLILWIKGKLK